MAVLIKHLCYIKIQYNFKHAHEFGEFDIERITVIKGPDSVYAGRGAVGG